MAVNNNIDRDIIINEVISLAWIDAPSILSFGMSELGHANLRVQIEKKYIGKILPTCLEKYSQRRLCRIMIS